VNEVRAELAARRLAAVARARLAGRRVVAVSIGPAQLAGLAEFGAELVGVIAVVPAGGPELALGTGDDGPPVLWLVGASGDIFTHVVDTFAATLTRARAAVAAFLARIDPDARATVIGYLPVPQDIFGARPVWAQDAALCRTLEDKGNGALATVLPTPRFVALRWPVQRGALGGAAGRAGRADAGGAGAGALGRRSWHACVRGLRGCGGAAAGAGGAGRCGRRRGWTGSRATSWGW
jgi:hypothetical protein